MRPVCKYGAHIYQKHIIFPNFLDNEKDYTLKTPSTPSLPRVLCHWQ